MKSPEELHPVFLMVFRFLAVAVWLLGFVQVAPGLAMVLVRTFATPMSTFFLALLFNALLYGAVGALLFFRAENLANLVTRGKWK